MLAALRLEEALRILAFLTDYPTPTSAAHLGEARMAAFCRRHAYRGGKSPAELLSRLRAAPVAQLVYRRPRWQRWSPRRPRC